MKNMEIGADRLRAAGLPDADLSPVLAEQGHPLVFATVSGAHLYGFPSRDSDVDLRGVHLLPLDDLIGLREGEETRTVTGPQDGVEMDLVTHDLRKFVRMMLRRNGYVLEQLLSPLVVRTTDAHAGLVALAPGVLTRNHAHHYRGFAVTQWRLFEKQHGLKPLLYTLRVLLTGIHLMRSGEVEAHLPTLLDHVTAPGYVRELIAAKAEAEQGPLRGLVDVVRVQEDVEALHAELAAAQEGSLLPESPSRETHDALHDLVVRARTAG